jgi:HD-GYP domain-containing protein (c-di-GMP phosphodiesterase class II)
MVLQENRLLETQRLLAHSQGMPEAVEAGDAELLRNLSLGIAVDQRVGAIDFLDINGNLVLSMRHIRGGGVEQYEFFRAEGQPYKGIPFIEYTLSGQVDEYGDKYSGFYNAGREEYFFISGPLFVGERQVGAVLVGENMDDLTRDMNAQILAQVTFYDFAGTPRSSTLLEPAALPEDMIFEILVRQDQETYNRELNPPRDLEVANNEYAELLAPLELRGGVDSGIIGVSMVKTYLVNASRVTRAQITVLVALAFMAVILIGYRVAGIVTTPILQLVNASKEIGRGNLDVHVQPSGNDEVAELTRTFNQMIESLRQSREDLITAYDRTIEGWSRALELRDYETEGHSRRVIELAEALALMLGLPAEELPHFRRGALLHDIGKMAIPDSILLKPGPLTQDEWKVMTRHPEFALQMIEPIEYLRPALDIPYYHHERVDGSGYPEGLKGKDIPLVARIFAVVDVWDAMCSRRPYHPPIPPVVVIDHLMTESGKLFDSEVVEAFMKLIDTRPEFVQAQADAAATSKYYREAEA